MNLSVVLIATLATSSAWACCSSDAIDVYFPRVPEAPYGPSALHGVVMPDFAPRNLALFYRQASDVPTSVLELEALTRSAEVTYVDESSVDRAMGARDAWRKAAGLLGQPDDVSAETADHASYLRVHASAFLRATQRLAARKKSYPPALLHEWVRLQSAALGQPIAGAESKAVEVPVRLQPAWKSDLALLTASAAFYEGDYASAVKGFDSLTGEESRWGPYYAARAQIRWATLGEAADRVDHFAQAEKRLRTVMAAKDEALSGAASAMLLRVLHEKGSRCELLGRILKRNQGDALPSLLIAFEEEPECAATKTIFQWVASFAQLRVVGWSNKAQSPAEVAAASRALAAWRSSHTQVALIAALTAADGTEADVNALIAQAHAVPAGSQIGPTVALHEVRLLRLSKQLDAARARLSELPIDTWPQATQNFFQLERFFLAANNDEALAASAVKKVSSFDPEAGGPFETSLQLDQFELTRALDARLTTAELVRLAALPSVPGPTRQALAWSALARTAITTPKSDLAPLITLVTSVDPSGVAPLAAAKAAASIDDRRAEVLKFLMLHPGVSMHLVPADDRAMNGKFVSTQFEMNGCFPIRNGWEGAGASYARAAMDVARVNPKHPLAAELLHLAVLFSKYTPGAPEAKSAFEMLHKLYGKSKFAADTPYFW